MESIGRALMLYRNSDPDKLRVGNAVCQEFLQLIASVLRVHIYLYMDKRINDAE